MKKKICQTGLFLYIAAVIYYIVAIKGFFENGSIDWLWVCLGTSMLCSGYVSSKKYKEAQNKIED